MPARDTPTPSLSAARRSSDAMEVADLLRALRRRWPLSLLVFAIALAAAAWTYTNTKPLQQSTSAVLLIPPTTPANPNPLLQLDNNLSQLAVVLAATMESDASRQLLAQQSATASFSIQTLADPSPNVAQLSARIEFTTRAISGEMARRTAYALVAEASVQLSHLQAQTSITSSNKVRVLQLSAASQPVIVGNGRIRAAGVTAALLFAVGAFNIVVFDAVWTRTRGRGTGRKRRERSLLTNGLSAENLAPPAVYQSDGRSVPTTEPSSRPRRTPPVRFPP